MASVTDPATAEDAAETAEFTVSVHVCGVETGTLYLTNKCMLAKVIPIKNWQICMVVRVFLILCGTLILRADKV
jgi:hypothetical protein